MEAILSKNTIRVKDATSVLKKLKQLKGEARNLQVIADFDHTISKSKLPNGDCAPVSHAIFTSRMNPVQKKNLDEICRKYFPIEQDTRGTAEEKAPYMVEWWEQSHDLITQLGFKRKDLEEIVALANLEIRDACDKFLRESEASQVPVLIFSAGIGDVIKILLQQRLGKLPSSLHVISNFMEFDQNDTITGFCPPIIHSLNKNATVVRRDVEFFSQLQSRRNVLLLGDSLGDARMDNGVMDNDGVVVKVGFFNGETDQTLLEKHLSAFDIVLVEDQTFDVPLAILQLCTGSLEH